MRRGDKAITDRRQIDEIIRGSLVCRLALVQDGRPYLVPLSFGYDGDAFYFHTAPEGRKIDCFLAGGEVCFECERHVELRRDPQIACRWSMDYESVIGYGTIGELTTDADKRHALNLIMRQYSGQDWTFDDATMAKTRAWKLTIQSISGKQSKPKTIEVGRSFPVAR
jgi:hypothetical protein